MTTNPQGSTIGMDQDPIRILGISGSLRKASFNSGLIRAARDNPPSGAVVEIFDIRDIPFYDGDIEADGDPASVAALKAAIKNSDSVIFATPEYNWGTQEC